MTINLPRTALSRREKSYILLLRRVHQNRIPAHTFEGLFFKAGARVTVEQLRPDLTYPENPLMIEHAGSDRTGRGHNRSSYIYVLWRLDMKTLQWSEIVRVLSPDAGWVPQMAAIASAEIGSPPAADPAAAISVVRSVTRYLDTDLLKLNADEGKIALTLLHEQIIVRMVDLAKNDPILGYDSRRPVQSVSFAPLCASQAG